MNNLRRRDPAAVEAALERRRQEDAAPRLRDEVEGLLSLRFRFDDLRAEGRTLALPYTRPIVVESAPALFDVRCLEPRCDGRHDLTQPVLRALRQAEKAFAGESPCMGMVGDVPCDRILGYACEANYRAR
jgi:hypothetical protein